MTEQEPRPFIPTPADFNGREMDYATGNAARWRNLADQYEPGTAHHESAVWMAGVMKDYAARLREQPLVDPAGGWTLVQEPPVDAWKAAIQFDGDDGWAR